MASRPRDGFVVWIILLALACAIAVWILNGPARAEGVTASWYGAAHHGKRTALGERFDMRARTCAHRSLPFGTRLEVCRNGRCVVCRVNDRGPYVPGRGLDLSHAVARAIGLDRVGVGRVTMKRM